MQHTGLGGGEVRLNLYTQCSKKRENSTKTNLHAKDDIHHNFDYTQLMAMITWTKKKFKQIYQYRTKGTYCGYMGDHKEIKKQHSF